MGSRRDEQLEELEGFVSMLECFDGSIEFDKDGNGPITGKIRIDLPPLEKKVTVFADVGDEVQYRGVSVLESCVLHFILPPSYPTIPPLLTIECSWMNEHAIESLMNILSETATTYDDQPMLYSLAFTLRENACQNIGSQIRVDNTPYAVSNNIDGWEMLRRLVHSSESAEQAAFERECHDCEVCLENEPGTRCVRFRPCLHVFCAKCVETYFQGLLKSEAIRTFECLSDGCSSLAAQDTVKKAIGDEEYERYETILLERALGSMDDMAICPRPSCAKYVVVQPFNRQLGRCDACSYAFCIMCRKAYHGVEQCRFQDEEKLKLLKDYESGVNRADLIKRAGGEAALEKLISAIQNDKWLSENSKKCPKCKADIEKNNGCNKMKCVKCKTAFCWLCGKRLDGDPYAHFSEENGSCTNRLFEGMGEDNYNPYEEFSDDEDDEDDFWDGEDDVDDDDDMYFDVDRYQYPDYDMDLEDLEDLEYPVANPLWDQVMQQLENRDIAATEERPDEGRRSIASMTIIERLAVLKEPFQPATPDIVESNVDWGVWSTPKDIERPEDTVDEEDPNTYDDWRDTVEQGEFVDPPFIRKDHLRLWKYMEEKGDSVEWPSKWSPVALKMELDNIVVFPTSSDKIPDHYREGVSVNGRRIKVVRMILPVEVPSPASMSNVDMEEEALKDRVRSPVKLVHFETQTDPDEEVDNYTMFGVKPTAVDDEEW